jgi:hypothetical protein
MPSPFQAINGIKYSSHDATVTINGRVVGVIKLDYDDKLTVGALRGAGTPWKLGSTAGMYEPSASMTLSKRDAHELVKDLTGNDPNKGIGAVQFEIVVVRSTAGQPVLTDKIHGVRLLGMKDAVDAGSSDPHVVDCELDVASIEREGYSLVGAP